MQDNEQQSDTRSESSSLDSDWSDLKSIAVQLGVTDLDNLYTERFKIDRQKLSDMIKCKLKNVLAALDEMLKCFSFLFRSGSL